MKTALIDLLDTLLNKGQLFSHHKVQQLMEYFQAEEHGHRASYKKRDLGYGWLHYGLVRTLKPKRVLCIGSRYGYIPAVLAQACKDNGAGQVDFVDAGYGPGDPKAWTGAGFWQTEEGRTAFKNFGLSRYITLHVMTTAQFAGKLKKTRLRYQYIYLDGDHSYQGVKKDFQRFWPLLTKGGFFVFHDISVKRKKKEGQYGVWRLWQELQKKQSFQFDFFDSGLGVIQKH